MNTFVVSFNIDTRTPYIYDLSSDHEYRPYTPNQNIPEQLYIDYASFPRYQFGKEEEIQKKWEIPHHAQGFCLLDDFYFFRTILQSESQRPTVVLPEESLYRQFFSFDEFISRFAKTYKLIHYRWRSLEPWTPGEQIPHSMYCMFHTKPTDDHVFTFRDWMRRVDCANDCVKSME